MTTCISLKSQTKKASFQHEGCTEKRCGEHALKDFAHAELKVCPYRSKGDSKST